MHLALTELIRRSGVDWAPAWDRTALVDSVASVGPVAHAASSHEPERGFNLVLFDTSHRPRYFCKCRQACSQAFQREAAILEALGHAPELHGIVPVTRVAADGLIRIAVSDFVPGRSLLSLLPKMSWQTWERAAEEVLAVTRRLTTAASVLRAIAATTQELELEEMVVPIADYLRGVLPTTTNLEPILETARAAGTVVATWQHSDLWPANVIRSVGGWCVLDVEHLGDEVIPMFDAFHLARTTWDHKHGPSSRSRGRPWIERMQASTQAVGATRRVLARAAEVCSLRRAHVPGLFAYYTLAIAQRFHRKGMYYMRHLAEVEATASFLAAGGDLTTLLLGSEAE